MTCHVKQRILSILSFDAISLHTWRHHMIHPKGIQIIRHKRQTNRIVFQVINFVAKFQENIA